MRATLRSEPGLGLLVALAALVYGAYGIVRHDAFDSGGFDLGIFDQVVWHYSHFQTPTVTLKEAPFNALGDHFSPILALLAPLYWIWSDPRMLIGAQAVLVAASVVPVFLYARGRLGRPAAYLLAAAYAAFWGLAAGVAFDVHEVAFAPLLVALVILWGDERRWRPFWIAFVALLLVKEDMAVLALFVGLWLVVLGARRQGAIAAGAGVGWYFVATKLAIPHFAGGTSFSYWTYTQLGSGPGDALWHIARNPTLPFRVLFDHREKTNTMFHLLYPFGALMLISPLALLAIPLMAERMLSTNALFWGQSFHYSMAIAPVLAMGAADGLANVGCLLRTSRWQPAATVAGAALILVLNLRLAGIFPLADLRDAGFRHGPRDARAQGFDAAVAAIPGGASLMASDPLVPHLTRRAHIYEVRAQTPRTDWIAVQLGPGMRSAFPQPSVAAFERIVAQRRRGFRVVLRTAGGVVVYRRSR